jgi:hypothetical protein
MLIDITEKLRSPPKKREPLNKFRISEGYDIIKGHISMKKFVEGEEVKPISRYIMDKGTHKHQMIQEYLKDDYEMEVPVKVETEGIILSARVDMVKDEVIEIKTSDKLLEEKDKYIWQLKMYLSMLKKERGKVVQPIIIGDRIYLNVLSEVKRDDEWYNKQIILLKDYYNKVVKKYEKNIKEK